MCDRKIRCHWVPEGDARYQDYHDYEWGRPVHDDAKLFEMLILEGMQAGLCWNTILRKRENFRVAFDGFDIDTIMTYDGDKIDSLMQNEGIIRNRLKLNALVSNAKAFREIQIEFGSFHDYIWEFVGFKQINNAWHSMEQIPANTPLSDQISKALKKRGFKFVGSTIIYAFMQAIGMVNDHTTDCFLWQPSEL